MPRLTTRLVQQLVAPGDVFVWDDVIPGFGVRSRHTIPITAAQLSTLAHAIDVPIEEFYEKEPLAPQGGQEQSHA